MEKVNDSISYEEFFANFQPYVENKEFLDDGYEKNNADLYLTIGDENSDVLIFVIVTNITKNGDFDWEIDDVENIDVDMGFYDEEFFEMIDEVVANEVAFEYNYNLTIRDIRL